VEIRRDSDSWTAVVHLRGATGELLGTRAIEANAESCDTLARATVLAITLTIDPDAFAVPERAKVPPRPSPVTDRRERPRTQAPIRPGPPPATEHAPERKDDVTARVTPAVETAWGVLPGVAWGGSLVAATSLSDRISGSLGMLWLSEKRLDNERFGFGLTSGSLRFCFEEGAASFVGTRSCASWQIGVMHAIAYVDEPVDPGQKLWTAAGGGQELAVRFARRWALTLGADAWVPIVRHDFRLVGGASERVFLPSSIAASARMGVTATFP